MKKVVRITVVFFALLMFFATPFEVFAQSHLHDSLDLQNYWTEFNQYSSTQHKGTLYGEYICPDTKCGQKIVLPIEVSYMSHSLKITDLGHASSTNHNYRKSCATCGYTETYTQKCTACAVIASIDPSIQ